MRHNWFTGTHRSWSLSAGDGQFSVWVTDYVRWRYGVATAVEATLTALGHPCCYMGVGRIRPIGSIAYAILDWAMSFDHPTSHRVAVIELTIEQARQLDPELVADWLDDADD